ncbi:MAG TPA: hypothetical protein VGF14_04485 [Alphaproteobacteria bacterium]
MPHAIIERSDNLVHDFIEHDIDLVDIIHGVMMEVGLFDLNAIKTREITYDNFMVGEKGQDGSFVHISIAILTGRTLEQRETLTSAILDATVEALKELEIDSITVEVREMEKVTYRKAVA